MKSVLNSTHFKYGFFPQKSQGLIFTYFCFKKLVELVEKLSKENPKLFEEVVNVGSLIEHLAKNEEIEKLSALINENVKNLNYLSCFVKEAFLSALNFKS